jgi:hypothetical protein
MENEIMSKRREYRDPAPTDAPHQKPGTARQANATQVQVESAQLGQKNHRQHPEKRKSETGRGNKPEFIDDIEMP